MKYVAFLRGIMPQIHPSQKMENVRKIFEELGFTNVSSFIASGNIIFETESTNKKELESKIEKALKEKTGYETATILRTKEEIKQLIAKAPFKEINPPLQKPHVTFFKDTSAQSEICYVIDPTTPPTPKAMAEFEKKSGKAVTTRTWNTVQRVAKLL